jgi:hypothetical protein
MKKWNVFEAPKNAAAIIGDGRYVSIAGVSSPRSASSGFSWRVVSTYARSSRRIASSSSRSRSDMRGRLEKLDDRKYPLN